MIERIKFFLFSQINSYSQLFFSNNIWFGLALVLITFISPNAGIVGFISVASANFIALLIGIDKYKIKEGVYGFNSLLIGLGLGSYFHFDLTLLIITIFASILTLFFTIAFEGWLTKYGLPFLSLSFLVGIWIVTLATKHFHYLQLSEEGVYAYNDIVNLGGNKLLNLHIWFIKLPWPYSLVVYFKSLGAIFFQYNIYAGLAIAIALLFTSRISFILSYLGFYAAWYYYQIIGANLSDLDYGFIGFNYILTAIAIGGFFVVPSIYSFLSVVLLVPLISFIITGSSEFFAQLGLSVYALPFNLVSILFLFVLKSRNRNFSRPQLVSIQQFSAEKHVYSYQNYLQRFTQDKIIRLSLPFFGKWRVNQGFDGEYTHKGDWQYAWDFVLTHDDKEFSNNGDSVNDFYCFNKPLIMPADGLIEIIVDGILDNEIGKVNLENNWGNTVVIKHSEFLYTKLSHIKSGSFLVKEGQFVRKGEVIASVGNSGRSPYPHVHFQVQETPFVGSKTLRYPIDLFLSGDENKVLKKNAYPQKDEQVENLQVDKNLKDAFGFIPGKHIYFSISKSNFFKEDSIHWEVKVDYYNHSYLYCHNTQSIAYFVSFNNQMYFTSFEGNKKAALYYFYLSAYRVLFGNLNGIEFWDQYPIHQTVSLPIRFWQDFIAPFYLFIKPKFYIKYSTTESIFDESTIKIESIFYNTIFNVLSERIKFKFLVTEKGIERWEIKTKKQNISCEKVD